MPLLFQCPECAQKVRWPEEQLDRPIRCPACNRTFTAARQNAIGKVSPQPGDANAKAEPWLRKLGKRIGSDPALMHEGAIAGALGGMVTGIVTSIIVTARAETASEGVGTAVGSVLAGIFFGSIVGFGVGILVGAQVGVGAKIINWFLRLTSRRAAILGGALAGAAVAAIVGDTRLALIGTAIGFSAGALWSVLSRWAESTMAESGSYKPAGRTVPSNAVADTTNRRWEILDSPEDQASYRALRKAR
jgi:hypothetical protein